MRVKTDARRNHILKEAAEVFRELGYERASMAQIAARVGGSKTTLYSYFQSKQELFATIMVDAMTAQAGALIEMIDRSIDNPRAALTAFGRAYLDLILSSELIKVHRIGIAEGDNAIGAKLYELGPRQGWAELARHLQKWIDEGLLRPGSADVIALHLKGLLEAGVVEPCLYGVEPALQREEAVELAIDAFLRAYAPAD